MARPLTKPNTLDVKHTDTEKDNYNKNATNDNSNNSNNSSSKMYPNGIGQQNIKNSSDGTINVNEISDTKTDEYENKEEFSFKGATNTVTKTEASQLSNFSKVFGNCEGFSVVGGTEKGGLFIRNVCKTFENTKYICKHNWSDIILKIRECTKKEAENIGTSINHTQLVEDESTMEHPVRFSIQSDKSFKKSITFNDRISRIVKK